MVTVTVHTQSGNRVVKKTNLATWQARQVLRETLGEGHRCVNFPVSTTPDPLMCIQLACDPKGIFSKIFATMISDTVEETALLVTPAITTRQAD